ncbi:nitroreductase family protein [Candidatus Roizmanbacteria bacterium]|nr:nitroreductase family protein [Candidatus Roizmanbacteria bacterium]
MKYKDRGYRHVMMETGIMTQNIHLVSQALHLGCCAISGFIDDCINKLLDIDGREESVTTVLAVGNKK